MSGAASCQSTDKSVCATLALPWISSRKSGRVNVAQTLLSVLVRLGTPEKIKAVLSRYGADAVQHLPGEGDRDQGDEGGVEGEEAASHVS
jgi:hypothetical protein